jgi:ABC-type multidrug transport system ATPase subunit
MTDGDSEAEHARTTEAHSEAEARPPHGESSDADRTPGEVSLTVDSLRRSFGDVTVLSDVSFSARAGTVTSVVGPNGAGKSTLLRIIGGLLAPSGGTVSVETPAERAVGYLPQTPAFRPQFTLAETLAFYADLAGVDVDPDTVLARVGLDAVADRRVEALSGGMTRLFGIAQATIGDPPILVLDEPSSGLDPTMTEHVGDVIDGLADEGRTVLLATHELGTVDRVADTVLVLDGGVVAAEGSPAELRERTGSESLTHAVNEFIAGDVGELTVRAGSERGDER